MRGVDGRARPAYEERADETRWCKGMDGGAVSVDHAPGLFDAEQNCSVQRAGGSGEFWVSPV